jgi:hypothetical protein
MWVGAVVIRKLQVQANGKTIGALLMGFALIRERHPGGGYVQVWLYQRAAGLSRQPR